jgi:hypothetical protein
MGRVPRARSAAATGTGVVAAALGLACSAPRAIEGCEPADGITPVCGFRNPEDLALAPGGAWLLVSQWGAASLVAWRISDGEKRTLFPAQAVLGGSEAASEGADDCPGPPDAEHFAPHGIDLVAEPFAPPRLLVVNHGAGQRVEFFEVGWAEGAPALWWRGCAPLPTGAFPNDVAGLPGGGFAVTNMMPAAQGIAQLPTMVRMLLGMDTGAVLEWTPDDGWRELPDSHGSGPNGVAVSADGAEVYFSEWSGRRIVSVRREGGPDRHVADLPARPDNLTWTADGRLLVAAQEGGAGDVLGCASLEHGTCAVPFSVFSVDPVTLEARPLLQHQAKAMGAASVALEVGSDLYLGTFAGDRIARMELPAR